MEKVEQKLAASESVRAFFSACGKKGGPKKSERKTQACRENGLRPCAPGKRRGRPFKKKSDDKAGTV